MTPQDSNSGGEVFQISPAELQVKLKSAHPPFLLDVREPFEYELANLNGILIPVGEIEERLDELPRDREIVVYCHHGGRSHYAAELLKQAGFKWLFNLDGGIDAWSCEVDPTLRRY